MSRSPEALIKCVVIGDGAVGKTCLLISYTQGRFPKEYVPTIFDTYAVSVRVGDQQYTIGLFDTAGQEEFDKLRLLAYPSTDVFLLCYSVVNPTSLENARHVWAPEISLHCPGVPFLLVGTQCDLRCDAGVTTELAKARQKPVSFEQGQRMARRLGAVGYIECSALTQQNLKSVFDEAIIASLEPPQPASNKKRLRAVRGNKAKGASGRVCRLM